MIWQILFANGLFLLCWATLLPKYPHYFAMALCGCLVLIGLSYFRFYKRQQRLIEGLYDGLISFCDNDFSVSLPLDLSKKQTSVITVFNDLAKKLRRERQHLHQRDLMLDKVVNGSNIVTLLVNQQNIVIFHNYAAAQFFQKGKSIKGENWESLRAHYLPQLTDRVANNSIISVERINPSQHPQSELWHCSRSSLTLNGQAHQLLLLKPITDELAQQELQTWKKAIRVVSHELNNSIAPISTMCHSGNILANRLNDPQLERVFHSISRRTERLGNFIRAYGEVAKVSAPRKVQMDLVALLDNLCPLYPFAWAEPVSAELRQSTAMILADPIQIEQVMINLLKNAHEAQLDVPIIVSIDTTDTEVNILIEDEGPGIDPTILQDVLLPFYSTKQMGSGIGLAICREIIEFHQGRLHLSNREHKGLVVRVSLPR